MSSDDQNNRPTTVAIFGFSFIVPFAILMIDEACSMGGLKNGISTQLFFAICLTVVLMSSVASFVITKSWFRRFRMIATSVLAVFCGLVLSTISSIVLYGIQTQ
jgi:hypothetical protein